MGEERRGRELQLGLNTVGRKGVGEGERESGLNEVGPLKTVGSGSTGQTGLAQADRKNLWFGDLSRGLKLMTVINLIN